MSPPIYASCTDCPSYLASAKPVRDLLLPAETVVLGKCCAWEIVSWGDCPCDLASCWKSWQEAESHGQSLQEATFRGW